MALVLLLGHYKNSYVFCMLMNLAVCAKGAPPLTDAAEILIIWWLIRTECACWHGCWCFSGDTAVCQCHLFMTLISDKVYDNNSWHSWLQFPDTVSDIISWHWWQLTVKARLHFCPSNDWDRCVQCLRVYQISMFLRGL